MADEPDTPVCWKRAGSITLTLIASACAGGGGDWADFCLSGEVEAWSLPAEIPEASGLAVSRAHEGLVWTHNDGAEGVLYGLDLPERGGAARIVARVRVPGPFRDIEDLELAPCADGWCLYLADTGDNRELRDDAVVVRVPEPAPGDTVVARAQVWRLELVFPDQPRDVEALAVLEGEAIHLLSKGRSSPPTWYRVPTRASAHPADADPEHDPAADPDAQGRVTLQVLGPVGEGRPEIADQITAATSVGTTADAILVRSYRSLEVHEIAKGGAGDAPEAAGTRSGEGTNGVRRVVGPRSLVHLAERQGEAIALAPDGSVLLASEAGPLGGQGGVLRVRCDAVR